MVPELTIDPSLKYWVLVPISIALVLFGVLRQLIQGYSTPTPRLDPVLKVREQMYIKKAQLLKSNFWNLPQFSFLARQEFLIKSLNDGEFVAEKTQGPPDITQNPFMADPESMMEMAAGSLGTMATQTLMMGWVNWIFAGFVVMKLPFPLTLRFKQMLQSGVLTSDLDVRWVSSISWYVIAMSGLNSVYNVLFGGAGVQLKMQQQPMMPMPMAGAGPKPAKVMKSEADDLKIVPYKHVLENVEKRVLAMYS